MLKHKAMDLTWCVCWLLVSFLHLFSFPGNGAQSHLSYHDLVSSRKVFNSTNLAPAPSEVSNTAVAKINLTKRAPAPSEVSFTPVQTNSTINLAPAPSEVPSTPAQINKTVVAPPFEVSSTPVQINSN
ncbi:hypothetical protein Acr_13g0002750 [Actinidia rufa]|uniref:Uncharacterized protein n=1 Tax=Actinidia rufa TaxID=165716 RepID=A0A7J0FJK0_9ERIC|nr:hypothetical protein Acr_13g0002750 [Actinidia rufa]